jgi:hypothetical protein
MLVASVGAKFLMDRVQYPRVWIATVPFDPNLPIRGRYVRLSAVVHVDSSATGRFNGTVSGVHLTVRDGELIAVPDVKGHQSIRQATCGGTPCWVLTEPLAYFIPEHAADPSRRPAGEELWVEASVPPNGPPRPIRLGTESDGKISVIKLE